MKKTAPKMINKKTTPKKTQKKPQKQNSTIFNILFLVVILAILSGLTVYSLNLLKVRSRDAARINDLSSLKSAIDQNFKMRKQYPTGDYNNLKSLGIYIRELPQDPLNSGDYKYKYISTGTTFVLFAKIEQKNAYAAKDSGKYNKTPLYYEIGAGENWQKLIPNGLK